MILNTESDPASTAWLSSIPISLSSGFSSVLSILISGHARRTFEVSSSVTVSPLSVPLAFTHAVFVYPCVVLSFEQLYLNLSPGSNTLLVLSPSQRITKLVQVDGTVSGSVTCPPHCGATASTTEISVRSSFPLLITTIVNTAGDPLSTVCESATSPSRSSGFPSLFIILTLGFGSSTITGVVSVSVTHSPLVSPSASTLASFVNPSVTFSFVHVYSTHSPGSSTVLS